MDGTFNGCSSFNQPLSNWQLTSTTTLRRTFDRALVFDQDMSMWDTSKVMDLTATFSDAKKFRGIGLEKWNVSLVSTLFDTFEGAFAFNAPIGRWEVGNVISLDGTFKDAKSFNQDISMWDVGRVDRMGRVFEGALKFNHNLCAWGEKLGYMIPPLVDRAFEKTNCPTVESPLWAEGTESSYYDDSVPGDLPEDPPTNNTDGTLSPLPLERRNQEGRAGVPGPFCHVCEI